MNTKFKSTHNSHYYKVHIIINFIFLLLLLLLIAIVISVILIFIFLLTCYHHYFSIIFITKTISIISTFTVDNTTNLFRLFLSPLSLYKLLLFNF